ncbi:MAG: hypothetical protein K6C08_00550 [Oscillospiraceae bacterium]|nr:hypothetical protein [Oscillospiraceae bacterium]
MKKLTEFGFRRVRPEAVTPTRRPVTEQTPVRSLVSVRFPSAGRTLTYYNDRFDLRPGNVVFVEGSLAGMPGIVETVSLKFRIRLSDYRRVVSVADSEVHGTFEAISDRMVSYDFFALPPEQFRTLVLPPKSPVSTEEEDYVQGEGYELDLNGIEPSNELSFAIRQRGLEYWQDGRVAYVSVRSGIGTAYIRGTSWYEVNFTLNGSLLREMYCDCPCPGLCKHLVAVAITLRELSRQEGFTLGRDFTAVDRDYFWDLLARSRKSITL